MFNMFSTPFTSQASRKKKYFFTKWSIDNNFKKHRALSLKKKSLSGKNDSKRTVLWTRTSILTKQKSININYKLRYLRLGTISSFIFIPFKNKIISLIYFNNGSVTYILTTNIHILFSLINYTTKKFLIKKTKLTHYYYMLCQIKRLSYVSCMEILPGKGSQYCRAPGTKARIITFDKHEHTSVLQLPSKTKKIFSFYSIALLDEITLSCHKKFYNGKAGYWRKFGCKPIVRGVAMNPVDHPHGGRTKAIKHQRTPWGKTTKLK